MNSCTIVIDLVLGWMLNGAMDMLVHNPHSEHSHVRCVCSSGHGNLQARHSCEPCHTLLLQAGRDCDLAIYFQCPEDVMLSRLLQRNTGRADDNEETIRKRVQVRACVQYSQ